MGLWAWLTLSCQNLLFFLRHLTLPVSVVTFTRSFPSHYLAQALHLQDQSSSDFISIDEFESCVNSLHPESVVSSTQAKEKENGEEWVLQRKIRTLPSKDWEDGCLADKTIELIFLHHFYTVQSTTSVIYMTVSFSFYLCVYSWSHFCFLMKNILQRWSHDSIFIRAGSFQDDFSELQRKDS